MAVVLERFAAAELAAGRVSEIDVRPHEPRVVALRFVRHVAELEDVADLVRCDGLNVVRVRGALRRPLERGVEADVGLDRVSCSSYQVNAQASAPAQFWSLSRLPQSTTLLPSCLTAPDVSPSNCAGGFAWSSMPHQLMLFVHSLCAFRTAWTTASRSIPFAVAPIRQLSASASRSCRSTPGRSCRTSHSPPSAPGPGHQGVDRAQQDPGRPVERHREDPVARVALQTGEPAPVPAKQRAERHPPGQKTTDGSTSGRDPERELAPDRGVEAQPARTGGIGPRSALEVERERNLPRHRRRTQPTRGGSRRGSDGV